MPNLESRISASTTVSIIFTKKNMLVIWEVSAERKVSKRSFHFKFIWLLKATCWNNFFNAESKP